MFERIQSAIVSAKKAGDEENNTNELDAFGLVLSVVSSECDIRQSPTRLKATAVIKSTDRWVCHLDGRSTFDFIAIFKCLSLLTLWYSW